MTFPNKGYSSIADYCDDYLARLARAGASIDRAGLGKTCDLLDAAFARSAWLFVCGNGGSAAIANHLLCDIAKGGADRHRRAAAGDEPEREHGDRDRDRQ